MPALRLDRRRPANVLPDETGPMLQGFVALTSLEGAKVYTDEAAAYHGMANRERVDHLVGQYVELSRTRTMSRSG